VLFPELKAYFGAAALVLALGGIARGAVIQVTMEGLSYSPAQVSAHVGDTIEWVNSDILVHTATAHSGEWDLVIQPNQKKSVMLKSAGKIEYYCRYHPNMVGQITVSSGRDKFPLRGNSGRLITWAAFFASAGSAIS
jgi:plastocyanin